MGKPEKRVPLGSLPKETAEQRRAAAQFSEQDKAEAQSFVERMKRPVQYLIDGKKIRTLAARFYKQFWGKRDRNGDFRA